MTLPNRLRSRRLVTLAAATLILAATPLITTAAASAGVPHPTLNCQPESYPPAGTPRNAAGKPYNAQFAANLQGGYLAVHVPGHVGVTFGIPETGYSSGTLFGEACGVVNLPTLKGPIADPNPGAGNQLDPNPAYNHNFILHGPSPGCTFRYVHATDTQPTRTGCDGERNLDIVPVGLTPPGASTSGVRLIDGYGSADGTINAAILSVPATNGGFNVTFTNTAKATAVLNPTGVVDLLGGVPILSTLGLDPGVVTQLTQLISVPSPPGGECTLAVGDLALTGLPNAPHTPPVSLGTNVPGGQPVTGPASAGTKPINSTTAGSATAFADNFGAPAIDPNMPPDPGAPGAGTTAPSALCLPIVADLFNALLGLPAPPGDVTFSAPVGFSAHAAK